MQKIDSEYLVLFLVWLCVGITACQPHNIKSEKPDRIAKSDWAELDLTFRKNSNGFPSRAFVNVVNEEPLTGIDRASVSSRKYMQCKKDAESCILHPGAHSLTVEYIWSKTESIEEQKKKGRKESLEALLMLLSAVGGLPSVANVAEYRNSKCKVTIDFEVEVNQVYSMNIDHKDALGGPSVFRVVNVKSNAVAGSQTQCNFSYEYALPYSDGPVPDDQCALHLFAKKSGPMTFYVNDLHPYYASRSQTNFTVFLDPGKQVIRVRSGHVTPTVQPTDEDTTIILCEGGQSKYFGIERIMGFWSEEITLTEISIEEALLIDKADLK